MMSDQILLGFIQLSLEDFETQRLHKLSGQLCAVLHVLLAPKQKIIHQSLPFEPDNTAFLFFKFDFSSNGCNVLTQIQEYCETMLLVRIKKTFVIIFNFEFFLSSEKKEKSVIVVRIAGVIQ